MKKVAFALVCCTLIMFFATSAGQAQVNIPLDRHVGEIFVAIGNGRYQVWHPAPPTATLVETITDSVGSGATAGCAIDSTYHPFTTNVTANDVFKDMIDDPQTSIQTISVLAAGGAQPTSVAFDSLGDSYVGVGGGNGLIEEYGPSGNLLQTLPVSTSKLKGGSPWMDLSTDAQTIYFTNLSNTITQFNVSSSRTGKFASISGATIYGLRVLPAATQTATGGLLLVAAVFSGSSNIYLLNSSGGTVAPSPYSVAGETNLQVLTVDPSGTSFWVGSPTTHNFYRLNLATGNVEVGPVNTGVGSGPTGLCAYGGFSAAQPQPTTMTASLSPSVATTNATCSGVNASNTFSCTFSTVVPPPSSPEACPDTVSPISITSNCFTVALNGINVSNLPLVGGVSTLRLVYNYSQIAQAAGTSDTGLLCDLTSPDGTKCEVHSIDATPNNGPNGDTSIYQGFDVAMATVQNTVNPVALKNELHNVSAAVIHDPTLRGGSDTTQSIFTLNEQPITVTGSRSCGYISPLINSKYNAGRTIPFKFQAITAGGNCSAGPFLTSLNARLVLLQVTNLSPSNAPPHPVPYTLSDGTSCPVSVQLDPSETVCRYRLDPTSGIWILNVDTSGLTGGGTTYFGTTIDDSHQIPDFSNTASGFPLDFFFLE